MRYFPILQGSPWVHSLALVECKQLEITFSAQNILNWSVTFLSYIYFDCSIQKITVLAQKEQLSVFEYVTPLQHCVFTT